MSVKPSASLSMPSLQFVSESVGGDGIGFGAANAVLPNAKIFRKPVCVLFEELELLFGLLHEEEVQPRMLTLPYIAELPNTASGPVPSGPAFTCDDELVLMGAATLFVGGAPVGPVQTCAQAMPAERMSPSMITLTDWMMVFFIMVDVLLMR